MPKTWPGLTKDEELEMLKRTGALGEFVIAGFAQMARAEIPAEHWSGVFFSWLSLKGHVQSLHSAERTEMFATRVGDTVYALFIVLWAEADALASWLEDGYDITEMLREMGIPDEDVEVTLMRDFS